MTHSPAASPPLSVLPETLGNHPQRLLMTADTIGGVWTFALDLCRHWHSAGTQVLLATMGQPLSPDQWAEVREVPGLQVEESEYRLEWMDHPWEDVASAGKWLLELERKWRPDAVHLNGYVHGSLPWKAPVLMTGHSCVRSWWEAVKGEAPPSSWDPYTQRVTQGLAAAGLITVPSAAMGAAIRKHYRPGRPMKVIPNGRDPEHFSSSHVREPIILGVGRLWDKAKNLSLLAQVAGNLSWPVVLAGESAPPGGTTAVEFPQVTKTGSLPRASLRERFSTASIYAHPALYEPFGLSVLEAALSGCALVLSDIPPLREIWGDAAWYIDPRDPDPLHAALSALIDDSGARAELAARSSHHALQYSALATWQRYRSAVQRLTSRRNATGSAILSHP